MYLMFNPRRMIPKLAVASLALTGCGDGGTTVTDDALGEALDAFCVKLVECFPAYYNTVGECVTDLTNYYDVGGDVSSQCAAALTSYLQCGEALSCEELDDYNTSCDDQWYAAYDVCTA